MKSIIICLALFLAVHESAAQIKLSFLNFNDFHARFAPITIDGGDCKPGDNELGLCYGGIARLYTAMMERRNTMTNPILLNAGDNFQGTLLYTLFRWNITLEFMRQFNFDASALGNHEFDHGLAGIVPYIEGLGSPVVAANIDASQEPSIDGKFVPSVTIEREGTKIGIIGCITPFTSSMSSSGNLQFLDEIQPVTAEAQRLKASGVEIIVLLSHSGYDRDINMANQIPELDIIVGSHSHTFLYTGTPPSNETPEGEYPTVVTQAAGHKCLIVQAKAFSKYLGVLEVDFDAAGEVLSWTGNPVLLDASVAEDPTLVTMLKPWVQEASIIGDEVLGSTAVYLESTTCYDGECTMGSFLADAMIYEHTEVVDDDGWTNAAIAIMNPGGIRGPMGESSTITVNDLFTAQPFQNTIDTIELQGKDILELMELAASRPPFKSWRSSRFSEGRGCFQVAGIHSTYNLNNPAGSRLIDLKLRCARCRIPEYLPVELETWYVVAMPSFLSGGSSFPLIAERGRNKIVGRVDVEVFADYIKSQSPIITAIEGRTTVV
ncbi:apyrase-like [Cloeon dipterum]|uniref:apyrase-like n=1 Tax=Cloeon dipterum TaxID=197152 RepID=UPI00322034BC